MNETLLYEKVRKENESKTSELLADKKKLKAAIDAYKELRCRLNSLSKMFRPTRESMISIKRLEGGTDTFEAQSESNDYSC